MKKIKLTFFFSLFIISLIFLSEAFAGSCSGTCRVCGQYSVPCGSWGCTTGGQTNSDQITNLPTGSIRNSGMSDDDGCPDNYPSPQSLLPFTVEGRQYTNLPTSVSYTTNVCVCN